MTTLQMTGWLDYFIFLPMLVLSTGDSSFHTTVLVAIKNGIFQFKVSCFKALSGKPKREFQWEVSNWWLLLTLAAVPESLFIHRVVATWGGMYNSSSPSPVAKGVKGSGTPSVQSRLTIYAVQQLACKEQ